MASQREQVKTAVIAAVASTMGKREEELDEGVEPIADLGAKSVNFVRIISALEDEFGAEIPFMQYRRKKTIGEQIDFVVERLER